MSIFSTMSNATKLLLLCCTLLVQACSIKEEELTITDPRSFYEDSLALITKGEYSKAAKNFAAIERDHPISEFAHKATIMRGYASYLKSDFIEATFAAEDFIKLYPNHRHTDYMYYLKAIAQYDQIIDVERDQHKTLEAMQSLDALLARFPDSQYSADARQKKLYAYNALAGKDMAVCRLYLTRGKLIPALLRCQNVVRNYSRSIFIEEALYRMAEIYLALGIHQEATIYATVLGHNYPASLWYHRTLMLLKNK